MSDNVEREFLGTLTDEEISQGWRWEKVQEDPHPLAPAASFLYPPGASGEGYVASADEHGWSTIHQFADYTKSSGREPLKLGRACATRDARKNGILPPVVVDSATVDSSISKDAVTRYWIDRCADLSAAMRATAETIHEALNK